MIRQHVPYNVVIHSIVTVNQTIAHPDDFPPRDLLVPLPQLLRQPRCSFADQFHGAFGSQLVLPVGFKFPPAPLIPKFRSLLRKFLNLLECHQRITSAHKRKAPAQALRHENIGSTMPGYADPLCAQTVRPVHPDAGTTSNPDDVQADTPPAHPHHSRM